MTERKGRKKSSRATDALARSNADLQQFTYVTSHDLQEPLRTITSYAELLERRYGSQLDESAKEFIGYIISAASHMGALIRDLLTYSRVANTDEVPFTSVDMDAIDWAVLNRQLAIDDSHAVVTHDPLPTYGETRCSSCRFSRTSFQIRLSTAATSHRAFTSA